MHRCNWVGLGGVLVSLFLVWSGCRKTESCERDSECARLGASAFCDPVYRFCVRPDEDAGSGPDGNDVISDGGLEAPCRRLDGGECLFTQWRLVASMPTDHFDRPTANQLRDGRVLITGADQNLGGQQAQLFDPSTGQFSSAGSLLRARSGATATVLLDGRVLVTGGIVATDGGNSEFTTDIAEIYDPPTNMWTRPDRMHRGRINHAAALLMDGRVLVMGGADRVGEVFDPVTGRWTLTGQMVDLVAEGTATRMRDGRVLVTGGRNGNGYEFQRQTEIFDPATMQWTAAAPMNNARSEHSATLLENGRILVAGGRVEQLAPVLTSEVYDPEFNHWDMPVMMLSVGPSHSAVAFGDGAVILGSGASVDFFDVNQRVWKPWPALNTSRGRPGVAALKNGSLIVVGGFGDIPPAGSPGAYQTLELLE